MEQKTETSMTGFRVWGLGYYHNGLYKDYYKDPILQLTTVKLRVFLKP